MTCHAENRKKELHIYFCTIFIMWCTPTKQGTSHTSQVHFEISDFTLICLLSRPYHFRLIFKHLPTKNSAFLAACQIQNFRNSKLTGQFSKSHLQRNRLRYNTQMIICQKVGVQTWFWYQVKAESVLLTMIPKTHFTQNVACSLFCGSASQIQIYLLKYHVLEQHCSVNGSGTWLEVMDQPSGPSR